MKSALRFNAAVAFLFLFSFSASAVIKDRYIFRVGETVVGLNDFSQAQEDLAALHCRFPDALLDHWVNPAYQAKFKKVSEKLGQSTAPLREDQNSIIFLSSIRQLWKLLIYVDGQEVSMSPDLLKSVGKVSGCPNVLLSQGKMRDSFQRWLRVEVYLRARYAPGGMQKGSDWRDKRLQSITQFVESIDKQLTHENLW